MLGVMTEDVINVKERRFSAAFRIERSRASAPVSPVRRP
jgi:hypothetical protein